MCQPARLLSWFANISLLLRTSCCVAFGVRAYQTGSGKTHTMMGAPDHPGINVQALDLLFKLRDAREDQSMVYEIGMEMREIYNENIRDLLAGTPQAAQQPKWNSTNEPRKVCVPLRVTELLIYFFEFVSLPQRRNSSFFVNVSAWNQNYGWFFSPGIPNG